MRRVSPLFFTVLLASLLWGCDTPPSETDHAPETPVMHRNEYTTRIEAAKLISESGRRDEALATLIQEAAANGRGEAVKQALAVVTSVEKRDQLAAAASLRLASVSAADASLAVASTINNVQLRDEVLAKLVKGAVK